MVQNGCMDLDADDKFDAMIGMPGIGNTPDYPYGLKICLTEKELE